MRIAHHFEPPEPKRRSFIAHRQARCCGCDGFIELGSNVTQCGACLFCATCATGLPPATGEQLPAEVAA